ncbi:hypothetical protein J437_LFUL015010, partial [Ladona fulva]
MGAKWRSRKKRLAFTHNWDEESISCSRESRGTRTAASRIPVGIGREMHHPRDVRPRGRRHPLRPRVHLRFALLNPPGLPLDRPRRHRRPLLLPQPQ